MKGTSAGEKAENQFQIFKEERETKDQSTLALVILFIISRVAVILTSDNNKQEAMENPIFFAISLYYKGLLVK